MKSKETIIEELRSLKPQLVDRYKVVDISLFGSVARQAHSAESDVDLIADFEDGADLFDLIGLEQFLSDELGLKVDIVTRNALRAEIADAVLDLGSNMPSEE